MTAQASAHAAYADRVLDAECAAVALAAHGRNDQLNRSAFNVAGFVPAGLIDRAEAESRLMAEAHASGYVAKDGAAAARATIKSGLDEGMRHPRTDSDKGASNCHQRHAATKADAEIIGCADP